MKVAYTISILLFSQFLFGQLIVKPIQTVESENKQQIQGKRAPSTLPFWDDFSITNQSADSIRIWGNDTTSQWDYDQSRDVYINATLAINPPTYNVATFDGLDQYGSFHTANENNLADQLQSDTIDLSTYNEGDNIYLSFYWQAGGNVEMPDEGDSLRLQFYNPTDVDGDPWTTIWWVEGGGEIYDSVFTQEIQLVEQAFLTNQFTFRFQSFGDLEGPFDAWHVDWIYMDEGRNSNDLSHLDRAFSGQFEGLFSPFTSMPTNQLRLNLSKYVGDQSIQISSLDLNNPQPINYSHEILDTETSTSLFLNAIEGLDTLLVANSVQNVLLDSITLSPFPNKDSIVLQSSIYILSTKDSLLSGAIDLRINDTIRSEFLLHNYYAFDDGSAEYAAGTNVVGGQIAVQFWVEEQDTLTHVGFHFPNIEPSSSGKPITLNIFNSLDDEFPLRSQQVTIQNDSMINGFTYYELKRPLIVTDTFFIAYEQNSSDYIGIGFDRSNADASNYIFENKGDGWERNERLQGALMIRSVFEDVGELALGTIEPRKLLIYPNPTNGLISIRGEYISVEILNLSGKIFFQEKAKSQHDFSSLERGLYLLKIHQLDGERTYKIIKK